MFEIVLPVEVPFEVYYNFTDLVQLINYARRFVQYMFMTRLQLVVVSERIIRLGLTDRYVLRLFYICVRWWHKDLFLTHHAEVFDKGLHDVIDVLDVLSTKRCYVSDTDGKLKHDKPSLYFSTSSDPPSHGWDSVSGVVFLTEQYHRSGVYLIFFRGFEDSHL